MTTQKTTWAKPCTNSTTNAEIRRLATFQRSGGEVRLSLTEYQGHKFLSFRFWCHVPDGTLLPTPKGISIRLHEVATLLEGLRQAAGEPRGCREELGEI